jgi:hypothetical protein
MRRSTYRTTAVIKIKKEEGQTFPWVITLRKEKLARMTIGEEVEGRKEERNCFIARLKGI